MQIVHQILDTLLYVFDAIAVDAVQRLIHSPDTHNVGRRLEFGSGIHKLNGIVLLQAQIILMMIGLAAGLFIQIAGLHDAGFQLVHQFFAHIHKAGPHGGEQPLVPLGRNEVYASLLYIQLQRTQRLTAIHCHIGTYRIGQVHQFFQIDAETRTPLHRADRNDPGVLIHQLSIVFYVQTAFAMLHCADLHPLALISRIGQHSRGKFQIVDDYIVTALKTDSSGKFIVAHTGAGNKSNLLFLRVQQLSRFHTCIGYRLQLSQSLVEGGTRDQLMQMTIIQHCSSPTLEPRSVAGIIQIGTVTENGKFSAEILYISNFHNNSSVLYGRISFFLFDIDSLLK